VLPTHSCVLQYGSTSVGNFDLPMAQSAVVELQALIGYALLLIAAVMLPGYPRRITFLIGFTVLLLLFVGIHNAWDTVTFIAVSFKGENSSEPD
jgi:hypothetical protein